MTSFHRLTATAAIALGAALSMTAGIALAGDKSVSADQILNALQPKKPLTRGLSAGPQADPAVKAKGNQFRRQPAQPQDALALARRTPGNRRDRSD
jgi:hypothetical protein